MKQPKAGILLSSGITLIEHVYLALKDVCREVVLVGHGEGIPESLHFLKRIDDNHKGLGPIGGLEALLSFGLDTEYLVSPCDLFRVTSDVFSFLISKKGKLPIVLKNKDQIEALIGRYPSNILFLSLALFRAFGPYFQVVLVEKAILWYRKPVFAIRETFPTTNSKICQTQVLLLVQRQIKDGKLAMHELVLAANSTLHPIPEQCSLELSNANTPEDLSAQKL